MRKTRGQKISPERRRAAILHRALRDLLTRKGIRAENMNSPTVFDKLYIIQDWGREMVRNAEITVQDVWDYYGGAQQRTVAGELIEHFHIPLTYSPKGRL